MILNFEIVCGILLCIWVCIDKVNSLLPMDPASSIRPVLEKELFKRSKLSINDIAINQNTILTLNNINITFDYEYYETDNLEGTISYTNFNIYLFFDIIINHTSPNIITVKHPHQIAKLTYDFLYFEEQIDNSYIFYYSIPNSNNSLFIDNIISFSLYNNTFTNNSHAIINDKIQALISKEINEILLTYPRSLLMYFLEQTVMRIQLKQYDLITIDNCPDIRHLKISNYGYFTVEKENYERKAVFIYNNVYCSTLYLMNSNYIQTEITIEYIKATKLHGTISLEFGTINPITHPCICETVKRLFESTFNEVINIYEA